MSGSMVPATDPLAVAEATLADAAASLEPASAQRLPLALKLAYTAFMAVLVPVYWSWYGPTNFLYFCDVALLLTLVGIWRRARYWSPCRRWASWHPSCSGW